MSNVPKAKLRDLFCQVDPEGICFPESGNKDEYDSEIDAIIPRLPSCASEADVLNLIMLVMGGLPPWPPEEERIRRYRDLAAKIYSLWLETREPDEDA